MEGSRDSPTYALTYPPILSLSLFVSLSVRVSLSFFLSLSLLHTLSLSLSLFLSLSLPPLYASHTFHFTLLHSPQGLKVTANGQDLGGDLLFQKRLGFSGTPSDLLPIELGQVLIPAR